MDVQLSAPPGTVPIQKQEKPQKRRAELLRPTPFSRPFTSLTSLTHGKPMHRRTLPGAAVPGNPARGWYFIDVIRTGSAPVETNSFRTAADLPREARRASRWCGAFFCVVPEDQRAPNGQGVRILWILHVPFTT